MSGSVHPDGQYRSLAWGVLFILIGVLSLLPGDQTAVAFLGAGLILLTLNLARSLNRIPVNGFTIALGAGACVAGALVLLRSQLRVNLEIELLPVILISVGVYCLWPRRGITGRHSR